MTLKVYFAASIRGGRDHAPKYQGIVDEIKKWGKVLTEHFTDLSLTQKGTHSDDEHIFLKDTNWIQEADVIIAEVTQPSLGVGYELRFAQELNKPVLCLFEKQENKQLSAMISGAKYFSVKEYDSLDDAKGFVKEFMELQTK